MCRKIVEPSKGRTTINDGACEGFLPRMLPLMILQMMLTVELCLARVKAANERLLARVGSFVHLSSGAAGEPRWTTNKPA